MAKFLGIITAKTMQTLLLICLLAGAVYVLNGSKWPTFAAGAGAGVTQNGVSCGTANPPAVSYGGVTIDPNQNDLQVASTTFARFFVPGESIPRVTTTFIGSNTTGAVLSCGQSYNLILGDGGNVTTYFKAVEIPALHSILATVPVQTVILSGAPTISVSNSTTTEAAAVGISNATIQANTYGSVNAQLVVRFPASGAVFGDRGYAICARYEGTNITDVKFASSATTATGNWYQTNIQGTSTQSAVVKCYRFPVAGLGTVQTFDVSFKGGASYGPATSQTVDVYLADITGVPFNGNLVDGSDNTVLGLATDVGRSNPNLQAAYTMRG